jgi:hypothetical protein
MCNILFFIVFPFIYYLIAVCKDTYIFLFRDWFANLRHNFRIFANYSRRYKDMDFNLTNCTLCARQCHTDRSKHKGFCATDSSCHVASICVHKGEEPFLSGEKGVCNVFFPHCNLACIFCQNKDISSSSYNMEDCSYKSLSEVIDRIEKVLDTTENVLGFVSPSHYAHLIPPIVDTLHHHGYRPTVVYNTNCYDNEETTAEQCASYYETQGFVRFRDIPSRVAKYDFLTVDTFPTRRWRNGELSPRW